MIIIRNKEDMKDYYLMAIDKYIFKDHVEFLIDVEVEADIKAKHIKAKNIKAWNIESWTLYARNVDANNIYARDIKADDVSVRGHIFACDIYADNLKAKEVHADYVYVWWKLDVGLLDLGRGYWCVLWRE